MTNHIKATYSTADISKLKAFLLSHIGRELDTHPPVVAERKQTILNLIPQILQANNLRLPPTVQEQVTHDILDEILGFGVLQPLLDDADISEVMVNGPRNVYIERAGKLIRTNITFEN